MTRVDGKISLGLSNFGGADAECIGKISVVFNNF